MKVATLVQFAYLLVPAVMAAPVADAEPALMARDDGHHHDHHDHRCKPWQHKNRHGKCTSCPKHKREWWGDDCHRCPKEKREWWPSDHSCHKCPWDKPHWWRSDHSCHKCPWDKPEWWRSDKKCHKCKWNQFEWKHKCRDNCPHGNHWDGHREKCRKHS